VDIRSQISDRATSFIASGLTAFEPHLLSVLLPVELEALIAGNLDCNDRCECRICTRCCQEVEICSGLIDSSPTIVCIQHIHFSVVTSRSVASGETAQ
jgi:hypothetical protein